MYFTEKKIGYFAQATYSSHTSVRSSRAEQEGAGVDSQGSSGRVYEGMTEEKRGATQYTALARAPGRVNLIGEHIDYNGYDVMPMAIGRAQNVQVTLEGFSSDSARSIPSSSKAKGALRMVFQSSGFDDVHLDVSALLEPPPPATEGGGNQDVVSTDAVQPSASHDASFADVGKTEVSDASQLSAGVVSGFANVAHTGSDDSDVGNVMERSASQHRLLKPVFRVLDQKDWTRYVLAGFMGVFDHCGLPPVSSYAARGLAGCTLRVNVQGEVPDGAGLSSSSALVVASVLAFTQVLAQLISREEGILRLFLGNASGSRSAGPLATWDRAIVTFANALPSVKAAVCAQAERRVGTLGGAMDQTASLMGREGYALLIKLPSLAVQCIPLSRNTTFVVATSSVMAKKALDAATHYNRRVVECRIAACVLARRLAGHESTSEQVGNSSVRILRDVERWAPSWIEAGEVADGSSASTQWMLQQSAAVLRPGGYTLSEAAQEAGVPDLYSLFDAEQEAPAFDVIASMIREGGAPLKLRDRATHVFSEAIRVMQFAHLSRQFGAEAQLGRLLSESHASCAGLYECSCPEVDELVSVCTSLGAFGARMTGAGWGGSVISMVPEVLADRYVEQLRAHPYFANVDPSKRADLVFVCKPSQGATVGK